jgi:integrase
MASIRRHKASKYWFACFTDASGKRWQKSTKLTSKKEAKAMAEELEEAAQKLRSAEQFQRIIGEVYESLYKEAMPDSTVKAYFERWLERKADVVSAASLRKYRTISERFIEWLGAGADASMISVSRSTLESYRTHRRSAASAQTINVEMRIIGGVFEDAVTDGVIQTNPQRAMQLLRVEKTLDREGFSLDQVLDLIAAADGEMRGLIVLGLFTGHREGEILSLRWKDVDPVTRSITFRKDKAREAGKAVKPKISHLGDRYQDVIAALPAGDEDGFVFPRLASYRNPVTAAGERFKELAERLGIIDHSDAMVDMGGRRLSRLTFHSLRHTFVSLLKSSGASDAVAMAVVGHKSAEISRQYTHIGQSVAEAALERAIPSLEGRVSKEMR